MILTEKMEYLSAIVLLKDADIVTKTLLKLGVVDFSVEKSEKQALGIRDYTSKDSYVKLLELRKRCASFLEIGQIALPDASALDVKQALPELDVKMVEKFLTGISVSITDMRERQRSLQQRINELTILQKRLDEGDKSRLLASYRGSLPKAYLKTLLQKLKNFPIAIIEISHIDQVELQLVFNTQQAGDVMKILERHRVENLGEVAWQEGDKRAQLVAYLQAESQQMTKEQALMQEQVHSLMATHAAQLQQSWLALRAHELYNQIQGEFGSTNTTITFSGWIPKQQAKGVAAKLKEVTANTAIVRTKSPSIATDQMVPTKLRNNVLSRPFELVVNTYGVVKYGHVDPTFMVSIFFTIMFGMMFADVGQGAIIAALALVLFAKARAKGNASRKNLATLMLYCGLSAVFFGVMFGSYFGLQPIAPVWFDLHGIAMTGKPHHSTGSAINSIGGIFVLSFQFGFVVLGTGLLFSFINKIRTKDIFHLFFHESGIFGAIFYIVAAHMIWYVVANGSLAGYAYANSAPIVLVIVSLLFMVVPIRHTLQHNKESKQKLQISQVLAWPAIWLFEMFEMTSRYFSSTLSFVRIGGMGIVHALLMGVFYSIAAQSPNIVVAIFIVLFVNVLVIGLEGLLAAVNSMRLHFYEFFSRYFESGGRSYQPISLTKE